MITLALILALLASLLTWPIPAALAKATWPARDPLVALLCWQAIGLAGGLSLIGAPLVYALASTGSSVMSGGTALMGWESRAGLGWDHAAALAVAVAIAARLLWSLGKGAVRVWRMRSRQRAMLQVVVKPGSSPCVHVIDVVDAIAFSIPGAPPMIVLSQAMLNQLDDRELAAVVAHERAHLSRRHHLLMLPFVSWREAFPWLPGTTSAYDSAHNLVELQADDAACNAVDRLTLARALARTCVEGTRDTVLTIDREVTVARVRRLVAPQSPLHSAVRVLIVAAAAALVVGPTALLLSTG